MRYGLLLIVIAICYQSHTVSGQVIRTMTYNIRYDNPDDGPNRWEERKQYLVDQIDFYEPHIMGVQEALEHQVEYLDSRLENYDYVGVGRDDGGRKGEYSAIFYHRDRFQLESSATFWLSENPHKPSVGWDAALPRICTYAQFRDKRTNEVLWVFNTHFDHIGVSARKNSTRLIVDQIGKLIDEGSAVVVMGDLNLESDDEAIIYLSSVYADAAKGAPVKFGPKGTFNGFKFHENAERRIDYIFVNDRLDLRKYAVLSDGKDLKYPSDHFPVFVEMVLN